MAEIGNALLSRVFSALKIGIAEHAIQLGLSARKKVARLITTGTCPLFQSKDIPTSGAILSLSLGINIAAQPT